MPQLLEYSLMLPDEKTEAEHNCPTAAILWQRE
jgi:hypothetical protein